MTTCGGTTFELWTDEMALSITPNPSIYRSHDRRNRAEKKYTVIVSSQILSQSPIYNTFDDYRMDWQEEELTIADVLHP